jgi:phosphatidate cytidylyltransferase
LEKLDTAKPASSGPLIRRIVSAFILMPIVVGAVHAGGGAFAAMIAFAAVIMLFEWSRMVERGAFTYAFYALALGAAGAMYFASADNYPAALALCAASGAVAAFLAHRESGIGFWSGLSAFYIVLPCIALIWLRLDAPDGRALTFLLFAVVWAADTGAFVFGKFIGGPKISHALSPSKTWAGIGGGVLGGSLVGAAAGAILFRPETAIFYFFVGGCLGAASVVGDLVESAFKRNFGLKDISGFIPGHGGALDRLDGMIFATCAMTGGLLLYMLAEKLQG